MYFIFLLGTETQEKPHEWVVEAHTCVQMEEYTQGFCNGFSRFTASMDLRTQTQLQILDLNALPASPQKVVLSGLWGSLGHSIQKRSKILEEYN